MYFSKIFYITVKKPIKSQNPGKIYLTCELRLFLLFSIVIGSALLLSWFYIIVLNIVKLSVIKSQTRDFLGLRFVQIMKLQLTKALEERLDLIFNV